MNKYLLGILPILLATLLLPSCSKDFDSNAPYADVTIVYGVLDADQSTNYIKIYRGFLTEGDAYQAATIYDSLYYFDKIKVELEEYVANRLTHSWELDTTTQIPREDGDFTTKQLLYVVPQPLSESATYKLVITNKESGRVVRATTSIVGRFEVDQHMAHLLNMKITSRTAFKFTLPDNGASYQVYQVFHYIERNKSTGIELRKSFRRQLVSGNLTSNENVQYVPATLYSAIASNVEEDPSVDRYITVDSCIQFEVWAVNEPMKNYVIANSTTGSVVTDRLNYTNVECEDGHTAGIFASRRYTTSWHGMNTESQEELKSGSTTGHLGFHTAAEYLQLHGY